MKSRTASVFAFAVLAVAPFAAGCAEEEAEGREVAYPVGVTVLPACPLRRLLPYAPRRRRPRRRSSSAAMRKKAIRKTTNTSMPIPQRSPISATTLDPYGNWVEDATYGTAWVPSPTVVGDDFTPYQTAGHWAYDDDYVWVSEYSWGWAPFHYGRWVYVGGVGWEWIPGRTYAGRGCRGATAGMTGRTSAGRRCRPRGVGTEASPWESASCRLRVRVRGERRLVLPRAAFARRGWPASGRDRSGTRVHGCRRRRASAVAWWRVRAWVGTAFRAAHPGVGRRGG